MRRFLAPAIVLAVIATIIGVGFLVSDGDWGPGDRRHGEVVEVAAPDGSGTTQAILTDDDRDGRFFPFGLFIIPLWILFFVLLARAFGWGRRGPGGPWGGGPDQGEWLEDWHRRQHERDGTSSAA